VEELNRTKGLLDNLGTHWIEGARIRPEGSRAAAIHFEDPDGTRIELYSTECAPASEQDRAGSRGAIEVIDRRKPLLPDAVSTTLLARTKRQAPC
jgi:catechol-2,3-dioxygenase